jgi:hypothetical protein
MTPYTRMLFDSEPRLRELRAIAATLEPGDWQTWDARVKAPMMRLVGYLAGPDAPPALCTSAAYDAVYMAMLDAWELQGEEAADAAA